MLEDQLSDKHRRRRNRQRKVWLAVIGVVVAFLLIGVLWFLFRSPFWQIRAVAVRGEETVSEGSIKNLLTGSILADHSFVKSLLGLDNILSWPDGKIATDSLRLLPQLAALSVSKNYFGHAVTVSVTERQPFAIWCLMPKMAGNLATDEECYWFDENGVIFQKAFDTQGSALFAVHDYSQSGLGLGQKALPDAFMPNFISVMDALKQSGIDVKEIALKNLDLQEIAVSTYDGPDLYFSLRFLAADDLPVLASLMANPDFKKLQYVDFRVENRAYYK